MCLIFKNSIKSAYWEYSNEIIIIQELSNWLPTYSNIPPIFFCVNYGWGFILL
jgi:hypothetical protein